MFTNISWNDYITSVIIFLTVYYLFIGFRYYRTDLLSVLSGREFKPSHTRHEANTHQALEKQDLSQSAQLLADDVQAYLNEAGINKLNKGDVIQSLKSLLDKYPSIKDSSFREFIQNLIVIECKTNCSIHLSEQEVSALW